LSKVGSAKAIIIGAGPAGLTAAYELLTRSDIEPVLFESLDVVGGIARSESLGSNIMDLGGHRFYSKSTKILRWWTNILPLAPYEPGSEEEAVIISYQGASSQLPESLNFAPSVNEAGFFLRPRRSRILFESNYFDYPMQLNWELFRNLGFFRVLKLGFSWLSSKLNPRKPEENLEDFFINRFGKELYQMFFKNYTEKVWRFSCREISADWGRQRIKGLNALTVILDAVSKIIIPKDKRRVPETSLIEWFLYPKKGCGELWKKVEQIIETKGAELHFGHSVTKVVWEGRRVTSVEVRDSATGQSQSLAADYFFSSMPLAELVKVLDPAPPQDCLRVADGLLHRDFMTVGVLLDRNELLSSNSILVQDGKLIDDNWIYVHERDVLVGRIQIFNNWSADMVSDPAHVFIGMEYFLDRGDGLWEEVDDKVTEFVLNELDTMRIATRRSFLDSKVVRVPNAYPAYVGTYSEISILKEFISQFENLVPIGRGGLHRYNNQDHSMLTSINAVDNIIAGNSPSLNVWDVNSEPDFLETK
jgi:protoporphyrinogen oxidase